MRQTFQIWGHFLIFTFIEEIQIEIQNNPTQYGVNFNLLTYILRVKTIL